MAKTTWQDVHGWYNKKVGREGHEYHKSVIFPRLLPLLKNGSIVDLACGQGVLGRQIPAKTLYQGYDIAPDFIKIAKTEDNSLKHSYLVHDVTLPIKKTEPFDHAVTLLAAQNIEDLSGLAKNAKNLLKEGGHFHLVINHPCFRIPRLSSWGEDSGKKLRYRRVDRYLSPLSIPIQTHPSQGAKSPTTLSFHKSLQDFMLPFFKEGLILTALEEWVSPKKSEGGKAKMEDRAREEFPLFLYLCFDT